MNDDLPPFARELLRRRNQNLNQNLNSFSQSLPKPLYPKQNSSNFNDPILTPYYSPEEAAEIAELRSIIADLEQQIADLNSKKRSADHLKNALDNEINNTSELRSQLGKINDAIKENQNKAEAFSEQVAQLQSFIDNKQQLIDTKNGMIDKLNDAYQQLKLDYDNEMRKSSDQIAELNQLRVQIAELNDEASVLRSQKRAQPPPQQSQFNSASNNNDNFFNFQENPIPFAGNTKNKLDDFRFSQPSVDHFDFPENPIPTPDFDSFEKANISDNFDQNQISPPVRASPVHAALYDSIRFDDDSDIKKNDQPNPGIDLNMTPNEMKKSLTEMQARKNEIESFLNKSPPKNITIAEARREKMKNESELAELEQKIAKIRLALKGY